ncbi:MAG: SDR family oxidoreductase [Planctomycetaceae bacterium]
MYTLLTGATGLVGRYLVRDLLLNGHELAVVVRPSRRQSPRERIEGILQHWESELGRPLPRPVVLSGDISEPGFGLSDEDRAWVKAHVTSIIHSAAILEFYGKDRAGEPWRSNLNGTQNMIQLCRDLDIKDIHHVSTAYVAGLQTGRVMEDNLDVGQSFRNDYEESKFLAEKLVRQIDFADHVTIYRPAVISGDSLTGYTNTYHGIYLYLRLLAVMIPAIPVGPDGKRHTPVRLRMTGEERRNIIPVEWVSAVMCRIFETPEARGKTFHIAPDNPMSSRQMIEYCGEYFNSTGAEFCGHEAPLEEVDRSVNEDQWMFERLIRENAETYAPYERTDNTFDMTNTKTFAGDIVCPDIDKTVIFRYIDYGNEDRWGKRKPEPVRVGFWAEDQLSGAASRAGEGSTVVGIDVLGAGGVQLTLHLNGHSLVSVERGLPEGDVPVLTISSSELAAVSRGERPAEVLHAAWQNCTAEQARELSDAIAAGISPEVAGTRN